MLRWLTLNSSVTPFQITESVQYRPDLISYKIYLDANYFPILLMFNNIYNIMDLSPSSIIYYPSMIDIQTYIYNQSNRIAQ